MKTAIDGLEITPAIMEVLKEWYASSIDVAPVAYVRWMNLIQDCLVRVYFDDGFVEKEDVKTAIMYTLSIKDELQRFIPEPEKGEQ